MQFSTTTLAAIALQQVAANAATPGERAPALAAPLALIAATPAPTATVAANVHDIQRRDAVACLTSALLALNVPTPAPRLQSYVFGAITDINTASINDVCVAQVPASLSSDFMDFASKANAFYSSLSSREPAHCGTSVDVPLPKVLCTSESATYIFTSDGAAVTTEVIKNGPLPTKIVISDAKGAASARTYSAGMLTGAVAVALGSMML
ncbi:hypothetical protein VHEMI08095 [[Torrubiella] hemipterigena]|uniref:Uncharacterized protein n=1 Tax=[Torrubiella] hemipterigena TaxID=1531966 RepID=A0A0A1TP31_9HYPO|nr:hypothetical protein VHEMI08095 [[Torrubiella] hemipterigena]